MRALYLPLSTAPASKDSGVSIILGIQVPFGRCLLCMSLPAQSRANIAISQGITRRALCQSTPTGENVGKIQTMPFSSATRVASTRELTSSLE